MTAVNVAATKSQAAKRLRIAGLARPGPLESCAWVSFAGKEHEPASIHTLIKACEVLARLCRFVSSKCARQSICAQELCHDVDRGAKCRQVCTCLNLADCKALIGIDYMKRCCTKRHINVFLCWFVVLCIEHYHASRADGEKRRMMQ